MCISLISSVVKCSFSQEGEYVLEKQVNGMGASPYDPSHNSTAVLVGKRTTHGPSECLDIQLCLSLSSMHHTDG